MMTGNGPPRSGWLMKVAVWPSLVGISICWSIMAFLFVSRFVGFLASRIDTIARKPDHDKARDLLKGTTPALNGAVRIAIVWSIDPLSTLSQPTGDSHDDPDQQSVF